MTTAQLDLGPIPTIVEPDAASLIGELPGRSVGALIGTIREWIAGHSEVQHARVVVACEPEDSAWHELVVELQVDAETSQALILWDELAARVNEAKARLDPDAIDVLNERFGVHLLWREDEDVSTGVQ